MIVITINNSVKKNQMISRPLSELSMFICTPLLKIEGHGSLSMLGISLFFIPHDGNKGWGGKWVFIFCLVFYKLVISHDYQERNNESMII